MTAASAATVSETLPCVKADGEYGVQFCQPPAPTERGVSARAGSASEGGANGPAAEGGPDEGAVPELTTSIGLALARAIWVWPKEAPAANGHAPTRRLRRTRRDAALTARLLVACGQIARIGAFTTLVRSMPRRVI